LTTFRNNLPVLFPNRTNVPKTLIFAKDDSHAEDITEIVKEVFGKGDDFCKKITYQAQNPEGLIEQFRSEFLPRVAVTVDMISTGTDIRALECLIFMRDVKSQVYFEQMKGRGTRTIAPTDLQAASGEEAKEKTHFLIIDAVGVCESDKTDSRPLERKRGVSFAALLDSIQYTRDEDTISSLASRLARLNHKLDAADREEIKEAAGGKTLSEIVKGLLRSINPDEQEAKAKEMFGAEEPTDEQFEKAFAEFAKEYCAPFDNPTLRNKIKEIKQRSEQTITETVKDEVISAEFDDTARQEAAQKNVNKFKRFLEENRDEITALQIIFNQPYGQRHLTYQMIDELAQALQRPPYNIAPEAVWNAYAVVEKSKVKSIPPDNVLTNIIALIRFAIGETPSLETWRETVNERFNIWLAQQQQNGNQFTDDQIEWLEMMRDRIANSIEMRLEDLQQTPFSDRGGVFAAARAFNNDFGKIEAVVKQLNDTLAA
jgi:type I restriction enzyme, R subunit